MDRQIDGHTKTQMDKPTDVQTIKWTVKWTYRQTNTETKKEKWSPIMTREQKYGQYEQYGQYGQKVLIHKILLLTSLYIKM